MPKQPAIPGLRDAMKKKVTRRAQFLAEMDAVVPWGAATSADRAALPEGWAEGRAAADAAGDNAAHLRPAELVRAERPDGRRDAV